MNPFFIFVSAAQISRKKAPIIFANTKRILPSNLEEEIFGIENSEGIITKIGLIEQAHKGTFYIDEVCNLNDELQSRFIKLLTEKTFLRVNNGAYDWTRTSTSLSSLPPQGSVYTNFTT